MCVYPRVQPSSTDFCLGLSWSFARHGAELVRPHLESVVLFWVTHDCCSFPVADLYRTLDAMSLVKACTCSRFACDALTMSQMNEFHWHITDSQSWPLVLSNYPELAQQGAYSAEDVYTPEDVQDIVAYAGQVSCSIAFRRDMC